MAKAIPHQNQRFRYLLLKLNRRYRKPRSSKEPWHLKRKFKRNLGFFYGSIAIPPLLERRLIRNLAFERKFIRNLGSLFAILQ